ncbi:apomucin [Lates calcarifer]|uniref:Apomucin n=1 Tax=Lates calcarifer TaxID=8187 RepID=A0AAJ8B2M5_LATCA|nr:apomucin [Lates calcarifer]
MVVFLATTVSTAPVEEKEREEIEVEATEEGEGELSEEEEDDDDSKSQDKIEGILGVQQTTTASAAGGSVSSGQSAGGRNDGTAGSSAGSAGSAGSTDSIGSPGSTDSKGSPDSAGSSGSAGSTVSAGSAGSSGSTGSAGSTGSSGSADSPQPAVELSGVSAVQTQAAGADHSAASSAASETNGSDGVDLESNGNGQKLLNGGGGAGGADSQSGVLGSFGGGVSHLDYTGIIDPSSHDFLLSLMGGSDSFSPDVHISIPGHMTPPTQLDSVISSGVTAAPSADQNSGSSLDSPADHVHQSDISIDQSGLDHISLSSDQSPPNSVSGSSHSGAQEAAASSSSSSHSETHREQTDGADSPDTNGNGRQTLLTEANGVTDRSVSFSDLRTDLTVGGAESVTSHMDLTASGLGLGHDVTESSPIILHTESLDGFTHSVSGVYSHTDLITMATDSTGTDTVSADPTGSPPDSSHPAVTDHTQVAGSVTEQYNPSGQGPEGAENVELEDTC